MIKALVAEPINPTTQHRVWCDVIEHQKELVELTSIGTGEKIFVEVIRREYRVVSEEI